MKSKLGIHCGFLACLCFLVGQFAGAVALTIMAGYILLKEENEFLRFSALKALVIVLFVSALNWIVDILPNCCTFIDWITRIVNASQSFNSNEVISKINQIFDFILWIIGFAKSALMLLLAVKACKIQTIKLPVVDDVINKYIVKE